MHLDDQNPFDIPLNTDSFIGIQKVGLLHSVYMYIYMMYVYGSIIPYINWITSAVWSLLTSISSHHFLGPLFDFFFWEKVCGCFQEKTSFDRFMGTPINLEALVKFFGWREIIGNYCKSLRLLEGIIRVRWISSAERQILSCGFLWKAIFLMICQRRQARNCADITHCRVKYESTVHLWYGFESFETTVVRFLHQVL